MHRLSPMHFKVPFLWRSCNVFKTSTNHGEIQLKLHFCANNELQINLHIQDNDSGKRKKFWKSPITATDLIKTTGIVQEEKAMMTFFVSMRI